MKKLSECLDSGIRTAAIAGHVHPDGDCVGSCMAAYRYLKDRYPQIRATVYLEKTKDAFGYLFKDADIRDKADPDQIPDLFLIIDASTPDRIGVAGCYLERAKRTVCIDHHVSNAGFAQINHIVPEASSASEVLYELLDPDAVSEKTAEALYTGIIHDTGVFQYRNTSPRTMEIGAALIAKDIDFARIIDESFNRKTYAGQKLLGSALFHESYDCSGRFAYAFTYLEDLKGTGADATDTDGIAAAIRQVEGVEIAAYLRETDENVWKVSLRSVDRADVNRIACRFGGGGHTRAAGCTIEGTDADVMDLLLPAVREELGRLDLI